LGTRGADTISDAPTDPGEAQSESAQNTPDAPHRPKLVLVDGHALVYRAYHALPPDLRTSRGEPTNAILGFTQMLLDTLRNHAPEHVVVTFDKGRTFRHEDFAEYKANRASMPDDLREQWGRVRQIVDAMGIPIVEMEGYEADDLIGTLAKQGEAEGLDTYILTADTDQHQLITEHVRMIAPGGYKQRFSDARIYDLEAVQERYGFGPELVPDYKALVGDKTDNIPNVPGIGEKTASALLVQYGSLEGILEHIDELKPKIQESLRAHEEQARHSKQIATIITDVPISLDLVESNMGSFDTDRVMRFIQELEFRSLVNKVHQAAAALAAAASPLAPAGAPTPDEAADTSNIAESPDAPRQTSFFDDGAPRAAASNVQAASTPPVPTPTDARRSSAAALEQESTRLLAGVPRSVVVVRDLATLESLAAKLREEGRFTIDMEATAQDDMDALPVGIAIALQAKGAQVDEGYYIPVGHLPPPSETEGEAVEREPQISLDDVRNVLGPILYDRGILKDGHNLKYDIKVLARAGLPVRGLGMDTMIAAYLLGETGISLKDLAFTRLSVQMVPITELIGKGRTQTTMDYVTVELAAHYAAADVAMTEQLRNLFTPDLERAELYSLLTDIEMPLVSVLADMELTGIAIDVPWLQKLSTILYAKVAELQMQIYEEAKHPFNINSTQQLGTVLFDELQLPGRKRTQKGYSTDREVLDQLRGLHPIVDSVIEYRQLIKLKNTYIDALPLLVRHDTGRVHTSFNQTVAATGRLSSSNPNLQNIPIRTEIGRDVRKAFIADNASKNRLFDEESVLLAADYSQIELRLLAHLAQDERLVTAFEEGLDIHAATAAEVMGVPIDQVSPDARRLAKTINFGVLYGMGSYGLARDSELTQSEAAKFIDLYWSRYPAVRHYMDSILREGQELGYVSTIFKRRRYMPELRSSNRGVRAAGERQAINAPVQGTAADIIKIAMNRLYELLRQRNFKSKLLLQVHDELLLEVPRSELEEVGDLVCETMESAVELSVPLKVDLKYGTNWGEMQPVRAGEA
jgi:DNA polymerase-1